MTFETKDTGERQQYASGMKRDITAGKLRWDLVDMGMLERWAGLMTRGAVKYGENNWTKACTLEEYNRFRESAWRHFMQYMRGDTDEDHAAAVFFNLAGMEYVKGKLK